MAQAEATGIPANFRRASWNTYEMEFSKALDSFKINDFEGGIFGDLYTDRHRKWVEEVCKKPRLTPLLPLWGRESKDLLLELVGDGFEAVVVAVRAGLLDSSWLGRKIDYGFIRDIEKMGVDVCGEKGEYHTLVVDGPFFKKRIEIKDTKVIRRDGMHFLEILEFEVEEKGDAAKRKVTA
jgi:uncharacterized protein (TIGR00290 family)